MPFCNFFTLSFKKLFKISPTSFFSTRQFSTHLCTADMLMPSQMYRRYITDLRSASAQFQFILNTYKKHQYWKRLCPNTRKRGRKHFLLGFSRKTLNLGKQLNVEFLNMTQRSDVSEQMTVFNETEAIRVSHTDGFIHLKWSSSMLCASGFVCQVSSVCFYVSV